jgi:selenocysteine-specific elongation factor
VGAVRELDDGLAEDDRALAARLLELYESTGFRSPRPDELPERLNVPAERAERLLGFLCAKEQLYRLAKNVVLSRSWLREAQRIVVAEIERNGLLDSADFKRHIDSTRKYALAILDWLDGRKVLVRRGNHRSLAADYRSRLLEPDP